MTIGRPTDESKLSRNPRQVRNRLRRKGKHMEADMQMLYGKKVAEWDIEELARGRPRDKAGGFSGPKPRWISPTVQGEIKRRLHHEATALLAEHLTTAVRVMGELLISDEVDLNGKPIVDAKTKFAAAAFIIEHLVGKPEAKTKMIVEVDEPKQAIAAAIILDDGSPQDGIIEGEFEVMDGEEDDDE